MTTTSHALGRTGLHEPTRATMDRLGLGSATTLAGHTASWGVVSDVVAGLSTTALIEDVHRSGLRGRGGGWFPTATKLRAVVDSARRRSRLSSGRRPVVIGNGMEGEPASGKDAALLASSPHLVLDGIALAAHALGANEAYLAVHRGSPVIPSLLLAIEERRAAGLDEIEIDLVTPPPRYVASEESALAHWVGSGVATPVFPDRPFERGAQGRPTLVQNVETLAHLALIARNGGEWFAQVGAPSAPGTTLVTVGGAVALPGVVEIPTGTSVSEILALCGGTPSPPTGFLTGGYGGGWATADFMRASWDPDSVREAGGVIGASVLWVLGPDDCPLTQIDRAATWMAGESAGQCGPCIHGLPAVSRDVHHLATGSANRADVDRLLDRLTLISNRGGCKHPDGTARFVRTGLRVFEDEVRLHLDHRCTADSRRSAGHPLPVPPTRLPAVDLDRRDFR